MTDIKYFRLETNETGCRQWWRPRHHVPHGLHERIEAWSRLDYQKFGLQHRCWRVSIWDKHSFRWRSPLALCIDGRQRVRKQSRKHRQTSVAHIRLANWHSIRSSQSENQVCQELQLGIWLLLSLSRVWYAEFGISVFEWHNWQQYIRRKSNVFLLLFSF